MKKNALLFSLSVVAVFAVSVLGTRVTTAQADEQDLSTSNLLKVIQMYDDALVSSIDGQQRATAGGGCDGTECNLPGNGGVDCGCNGTGGCTSGGSGSQSWVECDDGNGTTVRCSRNSNGQGCNCTRR
ncbi:MAG: hypothetical protein KDD64_00905 [Bdellovibrionales bacterium]|nr:hypothetical protein [Bdellovibrionales bacterium]